MSIREIWAIHIIAIILMAAAAANITVTFTAPELRTNLRCMLINALSWAVVWLLGFVLAALSAHGETKEK